MTDITDFDDLTVEQKAALNEEEIQHYIRIYAMEEGVPLGTTNIEEFKEEEPVNLDKEQVFQIRHDNMSAFGIVFATRGDAEAFLQLNYRVVGSKYLGSYHKTQEYTMPPSGLTVQMADMPTEEVVTSHQRELEAHAQISKANEEIRRERDKRDRIIERLSEHIWGNVRESRAVIAKFEDIRTCWAEYQELAKDRASAVKFMLKAYDDTELVNEALGATWNCETSPA